MSSVSTMTPKSLINYEGQGNANMNMNGNVHMDGYNVDVERVSKYDESTSTSTSTSSSAVSYAPSLNQKMQATFETLNRLKSEFQEDADDSNKDGFDQQTREILDQANRLYVTAHKCGVYPVQNVASRRGILLPGIVGAGTAGPGNANANSGGTGANSSNGTGTGTNTGGTNANGSGGGTGSTPGTPSVGFGFGSGSNPANNPQSSTPTTSFVGTNTDNPTHTTTLQKLNQLLQENSSHVDRMEGMPSTYLWTTMDELQQRIERLYHTLQVLQRGFDVQLLQKRERFERMSSRNRNGNNELAAEDEVSLAITKQVENLVRVAGIVGQMDNRMELLRAAYKRQLAKEQFQSGHGHGHGYASMGIGMGIGGSHTGMSMIASSTTGFDPFRDADQKEMEEKRRLELEAKKQIIKSTVPAMTAAAAVAAAPATPVPAAGGFGFGAAPATAPASGGLFGSTPAAAPAAGGLFGATPATPAPAAGGFSFGATPAAAPASGGLFGSTPAAAPAAGGLFGSPPAAAPAAGGFGFGAAATPAAAPAAGGFSFGGATPAAAPAAGGLFGGTPAASTTSRSSTRRRNGRRR